MNSKRTAALTQQLVYIGPALLFFGMTIIIPFVMGMYYSFT
ncbi:sugar ABC transporter permease, partial [Clostridium perfringens]